MADTFISYRREDAAGYAGRLHESLERRLGAGSVFRDVDTLRPGQDFIQAIENRLATTRVMFVVIGREWLDARNATGQRRLESALDFVRLEVAAALARPEVLVVPVLVEGAPMPPEFELPTDMRTLARRHAITVRDETWDADVDRLAAIATEGVLPARRSPLPRIWIAAAAAVAVVATVLALWRPWEVDIADLDVPVPEETAETLPEDTTPPPAPEPEAVAHPIVIPSVAQAAFGDLVYTVAGATVTPRGATKDLDLQIQLTNRGRYDANFWNATFRLAAGDQMIAPSSGLNELAAGNATREAHVIFPVPLSSQVAVLRVLNGDMVAEIQFDLTATPGAPQPVGTMERPLPLNRAPLLQTNDVRVEVVRATSHRFVNAHRLELSVRFTNRGRYPIGTWSVMMRVDMDGDLAAPWEYPSEAVNPGAQVTARVVFDLPANATRAVLHTSSAGEEATHTFELP